MWAWKCFSSPRWVLMVHEWDGGCRRWSPLPHQGWKRKLRRETALLKASWPSAVVRGPEKVWVTVSEKYAFGLNTPTGKLERKTSEKNRQRRASVFQWSLLRRWPGNGQVLSCRGFSGPVLLVKVIKGSSVPWWGGNHQLFAWIDRILKPECPWMAVLEEPKYPSTAVIIKSLFPLDSSGCCSDPFLWPLLRGPGLPGVPACLPGAIFWGLRGSWSPEFPLLS